MSEEGILRRHLKTRIGEKSNILLGVSSSVIHLRAHMDLKMSWNVNNSITIIDVTQNRKNITKTDK